jgi:putative ABC transport system ATP-binding protein
LPSPISPVAEVDSPSPVILLDNISKRYQSGQRDIVGLDQVSLRVNRGEWVAVVGPSGSGKSTLLNVLAGIDSVDSGSAIVAGRRLAGLSENELAAWRGREVGIVFQFFQLMPTLTVVENVMLPMDLARNGRNRRQRAMELLTHVGVDALANNLPSELSGGEQQRVAIARALANTPQILLADEPTGNLDSRNGEIVVDLLDDVWHSGTTIVMVTHDAAVAQRASRVVSMRDGQVADDVLAAHASSARHQQVR